MNIFKDYTFTWWQIGLFKLALLCFGVAIGSYWHEVFSGYISALVLIGIILAGYIGFISIQK